MQLNILPVNFLGGRIKPADSGVRLVFQITLGCGCPTCAGGRFDPERFRVSVQVFKQGEPVGVFPARYTGNISQFSAHLKDLSPGKYMLEINATDPETGAVGRLDTNLVVA